MQKRRFGRTGLMVTPLGFGAAPIGLLSVEVEQAGRIMNLLLDSGVNLIDTAASYAGSEEAIGQTISHRRSEFVLVSKCGQKFEDLPGEAWSAELVSATVDRALKRLRTDHLDVMLLHSCSLDVLKKGDALGALVKARDAGKVRFVGYSGDNEAGAYAAQLSDVAVIETSVNIVDQANIDTLLPLAVKNDIGIIVKRPIANAAWRSIDQQRGMYKDYAKEYHRRFAAMGLKLEDFKGEQISDWAELAMRFTISQAGVHTVIIGTTNPDNARKNVVLAGKSALSAEAIKKIRDAFARAQQAEGKQWPALT